MSIPIEKTLDEVRQDLFDKISAVQQDGWLPEWLNLNRGPVRGMIELWAWGLYQLYTFLVIILPQAFPSSATGLWLDLHCRRVTITRQTATKAEGTIYFTREGTTGNVSIQAGKIVKTLTDGQGEVYRFVTTEDVVLPDGSSEIAVSVEAEEYGAPSNVTAGMITEIVTTIPGVDAVENKSDWLTSEGADAEEDEPLRERFYLKWQEINGCTAAAYESWARSVTGVVEAKVLDWHPRGPMTVDVVLTGSAGIPTQELIDAVDTVVQENKPGSDDALVKGPLEVLVDITGELELLSGDPDAILAEADNRLRALFTYPSTVTGIESLTVGQDITLDLLTSVVMAIDGVKKINWSLPAEDVSVSDSGLGVLDNITLTSVWASEE